MPPESFPLIDLAGTPHARGQAYGTAVPERIARSVALYRGQMQRRGVGLAEQYRLARGFMPTIEAYDSTYLEEMRGIAEGADVALEDIVIINCRTEMMFGYETLGKTEVKARCEPDDGCTGIIVMPEAARDGRLIHAHNWDWREECVDTGVVLRIRYEHSPDILVFAEAGALARHGFNSAGVAITGNFLMCERDYAEPGEAPLALLRRKLLEAHNLAGAMGQVFGKSRLCSNNLMLSHADGEAVDLECAPDEVFWMTPEDGLLVHANHWINPVARVKLTDLGIRNNSDSIYRQRRVAAALHAKRGSIGIDDITAALFDEFGKPDSVLRSPKQVSFESISATVATTIMDTAARRMWIARQPYLSRNFVEYTL
ncbi:MAG: peptidase C45 [Proteobacteria bacterium]|uniref:C45 family autoproteolytic acyltransferase/hydolase n=1 Tax=Rudaea sp. TaxID=2136325 RepID=UPI0037849621|nr:peptidase C45 [Pseudomonadota bacterium]